MQSSLSPRVWPTRRKTTSGWFTALLVGLLLPLSGLTAWAQPTVLGTSIANGSYATYNLNTVSGFKQVTIQATGNIGAGTGLWEYTRGTAASPDYNNNNWRPYTGPVTFSGFNTFIPGTAAEGARYNTGVGGATGRLPAVTSGRYYTFNVTNSGNADNTMQVLETAFNPVSITTVAAAGSSFPANTPTTINITASAAPAAGENVYVRYSTNAFSSSNNLVQASFSGTSGIAQIPAFTAGTTITYYVFSSNKTIAQITSDNTTYSTALGYDMATLRLNNNNGSNYSYATTAAATGTVLVQSSGGTASAATTTYTTVNNAFAAINTGTAHTGNIRVFLNAATITEISGAYLQASGQGNTNYTSILVQPIIDAVTVQAPATANGVIGLIGVSNVTIDGDNPNTTGVNRNLTLLNSSSSTSTSTTIIRVSGLSLTTPVTATNNTIRNCNLTGNGTGGTGTSNATNTTFAIYAANDPTAIGAPSGGISLASPAGARISGLTIANNLVTTCARPIFLYGVSTTPAADVLISNNTLGGTTTASQISAVGIYTVYATSPIISGNTIRNLAAIQSGTNAGTGLYLGTGTTSPTISGNTISAISQSDASSCYALLVDAGVTTPTITGNTITNVQASNSSAFAAAGILVRNSSPCTITNNSISSIASYFKSGTSTNYDGTFGAFGIRLASIASGSAHKLYYNSINLSGTPLGSATSTGHSSCLLIATGASQAGMDIRNNIFANSVGAASAANTCISFPDGLSNAFNLTLNNNAYYAPATAGNYIAQTFSSTATVNTYTAANFNAAATTPATNLRSYTSTLSTAGTNDNLSFASNGAVPFTSATNLVIPASTATQVESGATPISGITTDLTGAARATGSTFPPTAANTNPDMGAYEGSYTLPATATVSGITYTKNGANTGRGATNQQVTGLNIAITGTANPRVLNSITFNLGSTAVADITNARLYSTGSSSTFATTTLVATTGTIASPSYTLTLSSPVTLATGNNYFFLTYDISATATLNNTVASTPTAVNVSGSSITSLTLSGGDNTRTIVGPLNGTYTVGQATIAVPTPSYLTITAAIADLTTRGVSGPVTFSLINPGTTPYNTANGETFPLNVLPYVGFSAANTVTFKPALLASPVISNGSATALFKLTDVSYVTIDGSNLLGGTSRDLSLTNTNTAGTALVWIATSGGTLSHDNQVLNTVMQGGSNASTNTSAGVMVSSTSYNSIGADNDNITISNNTIQSTYMGIVCGGTTAVSAGGLNGLVITNNIVGPATVAATTALGKYGIFVQGAVAPTVTDNTVRNVVSTVGDVYGITMANTFAGVTGATVSNNTITGISGAATGVAYGLQSTATNLTANANTISNVAADYYETYGAALVGSGSSFTNNTISNIVNGASGSESYGLRSTGASLTATGNTISGVSSNYISSSTDFNSYGMYLTGATSTVSNNVISNITAGTGGSYAYGMYLGSGFAGTSTTAAVVDRNKIATITAANALGYSGIGVYVATGTASANLRLSNNFVADVRGRGYSDITLGGIAGILLTGTQSGINIYHNSVSLSGTYTPGSTTTGLLTAALAVTSGSTVLDVRDNIFANTLASTSGTSTSYAFYSAAAKAAYATINYNDYYVSGTQGVLAYFNSGNRSTLAALQDATNGTAQDAASRTGNPQFTSATDLHIASSTASAAESSGVLIAAAGNDVDNQTRGTYPLTLQVNGGGLAPDLGADEGDFTPAPTTDIRPTALVNPTATGCYPATQTVTVRLQNASATFSHSFTANPTTITVAVTGAVTQTLTFTVNNNLGNPTPGTALAPGATIDVNVGNLNMSAAGTYTFAISTSTTGDVNTGNDALTPNATRTVTPTYTQPQAADFTGFTGANLATIYPGWSEATGATAPSGTTSAWLNGTLTASGTSARVRLSSNLKREWIVLPKILATATTTLTFDAEITDADVATADPAGMTGTDDFVEVRISTDCGTTFTALPTSLLAQFNAGNQPGNGTASSYSVNLGGTYAGQQIILAFFASEGTVTNTPSYDFHLDNINVASPVAIDLAPTALATPASGQSCYTAAETVSVTVRNQGTSTLNFNNTTQQGSVTVTVTKPNTSTQTFTGTITSGTLASGNTTNVVLTPTLDMSAAGTYTFAISATVTGDLNASNDNLSPNPTRAVAAPTVGTLSSTTASFCNSGSATISLSASANGTAVLQSSTDGTSFADVTGATLPYATGTLTQTTYYRVQVRCATTVTSNVVTVTNTAPTQSVTAPASACAGSSFTIGVTTNSSGGALSASRSFSPGQAIPDNNAIIAAGNMATVNISGATAGAVVSSSTRIRVSLNITHKFDNEMDVYLVGPTGTYQGTLELTTDNGGTGSNYDNTLLDTNATNIIGSTSNNTAPFAGTYRPEGATNTAPTLGSYALPAGALNGTNINGAWTLYVFDDASGDTGTLNSFTLTINDPSISPNLVTGPGTISAPVVTSAGTAGNLYTYTVSGAPAASNSYTIATAEPNGCTVSSTKTVVVTPAATANAGTAPAKVCAGYTYSTTGSFGGSATSATYTSSGTGTFSNGGVINSSTTSVTYSPSAADITAGSVTLTLTTSGPCAAATSTLPLTINSSSTWTGATNGEWNNAGNWDNCIPNLQVNAIVPVTNTAISDGVYYTPPFSPLPVRLAQAKDLTVAAGAYMEFYGHDLQLAGNLVNNGDMFLVTRGDFSAGNNLQFVGSAAQTATRLPEQLYTLTVNKPLNNVTVLSTGVSNGPGRSTGTDFQTLGELTMTSGLLDLGTTVQASLADYGQALILPSFTTGPALSETNTSYILGRVRVLDYADETTTATFGGLGLTLTPDASSTVVPGETNAIRTTGTVLNGAGTSQSVKRWFRIMPTNDAGLNVTLKMDLFEHERNGIANANLQLFSAPIPMNGGAPTGPWAPYRASALVAASNGSYATAVQVSNLTHLSDWTLGNSANPLPVELTKFEAVRVGQNARLDWSTASEKNNAGFEVQVSTNGQAFRKLQFVEPASASSTSVRSYTYTDLEAGKAGLRYYRLRQLDLDGTDSFSPVRTVDFGQANVTSLTASPNPFSTRLTLQVQARATTSALLTMTDASGRTVRTQLLALPAGQSQPELSSLESLPAGMYLLHLTLDGQTQHVKVVKQ